MTATLTPATKAWLVDTGERVGSTVAEAGLGWLTTYLAHLPAIYVLLFAPALAVLKAQVAKLANGTVSPASLAPAQQPGQAEQDAPPSDVVDSGGSESDRTTSLSQPVAYTAPRVIHYDAPSHLNVARIPELHAADAGRLGRHIEHDTRSRAFRITRAPELQTVSWKRHVPAFDQGQTDSCTGNALAGVLSTQPFTHRYTEKRARAIYSQATQLDNIPGSWPPDDTGSSGLAVCKAAKNDRLIAGYRHAFGIDDLIHALQTGALAVGVNWYDAFDQPDSGGRVALTPGSTVRGGHEFEIAGVHLARPGTYSAGDLLECWQSWGPDWGDHGRFYVSVADMDRLLHEQGDVVQPTG